jgi:hypothetical protein
MLVHALSCGNIEVRGFTVIANIGTQDSDLAANAASAARPSPTLSDPPTSCQARSWALRRKTDCLSFN